MKVDRPASNAFRPANAGVYYALGLIVATLTVLSIVLDRPNYLAEANISNVLDQSALVGILAIFTTIVLISGNFDLSIASTAALGAALFLIFVSTWGLWIGLGVALIVGALIGLVNGVIVQKIGINAFIVTLGMLVAVRSLVLIVTNGRSIRVETEVGKEAIEALNGTNWTTPNLLLILGIILIVVGGYIALARREHGLRRMLSAAWPGAVGIVMVVASAVFSYALDLSQRTIFMIILAFIAGLVLRFTIIGRRLYAVGGNAEAARLSGISVNRYKMVAFILNGLAAAFVGCLYAARIGSTNPTALSGYELTAIAAAILGGTSLFGGSGKILKSLAGVLILTALGNGFNVLNLGANWQGLIEGAVLITAASIYTIAGRKSARRVLATDVDESPPEEQRFSKPPDIAASSAQVSRP